jgi:hypothetical protein
VTSSKDEENSNDQSFFQKLRAKKKDKKVSQVVSLASLVKIIIRYLIKKL